MTNTRKAILTVLAAIFLAAAPAGAQTRVEVAGSGGYQFGGPIHIQGGDIVFADAVNFGFSFSLLVRPNARVEFSYSRQNTSVDFRPLAGAPTPLYDAAVEYYQLGGIYERGGRLRPFALASMGVVRMDPKAAGYGSEARFSIALGGGLKVSLTPRLGLRLQGRLLAPVLSAGSAFLAGPGGSFLVVGNQVLIRGDLAARLYFGF